jgi:galactose oxidase
MIPHRRRPSSVVRTVCVVLLWAVQACRDAPDPTELTPLVPAAAETAAPKKGKWAAAFPTPVVAVHTSLLPTGKVLFWGQRGQSVLWDAANQAAGFTTITKTYEIFCSGHTFLADGRLLVTGGTIGGPHGDPRSAIFNPAGSWSTAAEMAQGRYYPTLTTLPNGDVLALSGSDESGATVVIPEVWNGSSWRRLTGASLAIDGPYYPAVFVAPNGKVFLAGYQKTTRYLDVTGAGAWITVANRKVTNRMKGTAVMYAPGKILYVGGGDPPTSTAEVIDLNQATPAWRTVPGMAFARRQLNATILADGKVLITHGSGGPGFNNVAASVRAAELWNPSTETWTTMAAESKLRAYHSVALLLPDGRVLSSGSGEGGGVTFASSELSGQVFSPPYLFNPDGTLAKRPVITSAPARIGYGQSFTVETQDAGAVTRGNLIRLSSVTHAFNMSQVIYPLSFSATGPTTLRATAPASGKLAPPGPYMLFLLNGKGVPSKARMVLVGP